MSDLFRREIAGTRWSWTTVAEWLVIVFSDENNRAASDQYDKRDRLYRSLQAVDIRFCRDRRALGQLERLFNQGRYCDIPQFHGLRTGGLAAARGGGHATGQGD